MFETTRPGDVLDEVRDFDFAGEPVQECGAARIDAIRELDRAIRAAQAEQAAQIAALVDERFRLMVGSGDPVLSVVGEVAMARTIGPTAAGNQVELAPAALAGGAPSPRSHRFGPAAVRRPCRRHPAGARVTPPPFRRHHQRPHPHPRPPLPPTRYGAIAQGA